MPKVAPIFLTADDIEAGVLAQWRDELEYGFAPRKTRMLALLDLVGRLVAENEQLFATAHRRD